MAFLPFLPVDFDLLGGVSLADLPNAFAQPSEYFFDAPRRKIDMSNSPGDSSNYWRELKQWPIASVTAAGSHSHLVLQFLVFESAGLIIGDSKALFPL